MQLKMTIFASLVNQCQFVKLCTKTLIFYIYGIMQIIRGGKLLWLKHLIDICGKTFTVVSFVQYLFDQLYENLLENFVVAS